MLKCTAFFTMGRGGWSETWFADGTNLKTGLTALGKVVPARMGLAAEAVTCIGFRVSAVENPAIFAIEPQNLVGLDTNPRDLQNAAALYTALTRDYDRRQVWIRGVPDIYFISGLFISAPPFTNYEKAWIKSLINNGLGMRVHDQAQPLRDVASIDGTGLLTTFDNDLFAKGDTIKFFRARDTLNRPIKGTFKIASHMTGTATYQLLNWPAGRLAVSVRARKLAYIFKPLYSVYAIKGGDRKTGRPFGTPVGRRRVVKA